MKKIIAVGLVLVSMMGVLASCGSFECDLCGEEKKGKKYEEELFGQKIVYCKDCHEGLEEIGKVGENLKEGLEDLFN
jgi:hypothetical protein